MFANTGTDLPVQYAFLTKPRFLSTFLSAVEGKTAARFPQFTVHWAQHYRDRHTDTIRAVCIRAVSNYLPVRFAVFSDCLLEKSCSVMSRPFSAVKSKIYNCGKYSRHAET